MDNEDFMNDINMGYYILDENKIAHRASIKTFLQQRKEMLEHGTKHVCKEYVNDKLISTVWLGLDHNHVDGPPLLFETMIFNKVGGYRDIYCNRYSTWEEAEEGHKKAVEWVKNERKD